MPILFCNVGWMKNYNGINGDSIARGGEYNSHSIGNEVCNFTPVGTLLYGYVQVGGNINIDKLGASKKDNCIEGVTIIWTAGLESGGTVVVGWYKDATVYREKQVFKNTPKMQKKNEVCNYRIVAQLKDCKLLDEENRTLKIPRSVKGGIGHSNIWYADKPEAEQILQSVLKLVSNQSAEELPDIDLSLSAIEGNSRLATHLIRERSRSLVKKKKESVLNVKGKLACEVCGFDFQEAYGNLGNDFCEVHHLKPISKANGLVETKLEDLAIVCSNCHRVIHRTKPMISIKNLAKVIGNTYT